jgi:hypothetical protein
MATVYFRGSREQAQQLARRLALILTGREPDTQHIARGVYLTLGFAALSDIKADFIVKARGGTGEDGNKWRPLKPSTIAYGRRFGPGEQSRLKKAAGLGKANRFGIGQNTGLLTAAQKKRWQQIFGTRLQRFLLSMSPKEAKAKAAAIAWTILKREGAKTKLEVFGNRQVEILRDTGILFNSLSPGELTNPGPAAVYTPPSSDGGAAQVFQLLNNGVIVGTNVPYAGAHQNGNAAKGIPARPFLPNGEPPDLWEQRWLDAGLQALEVGARMLYEAA